MKKISKITLENFRAFLGKKEIDFNNTEKKPADFVCIYGKNGFGKTSIFDSFEWFFTGKISLLEKDLKANRSNYEGYILKNRYALDEDRFGVSVKYSDGTEGHRTGVKRGNSINDYGKGRSRDCCKDLIDEKQILPHSKIDTFVYARKPSEVYDEWGDLWDPDRRQREAFKTIYAVYKEYINQCESYNEELENVDKRLQELEIENKIKEYNRLVQTYNKIFIEGIPELQLIKYDNNKKIDLDNCKSEEDISEKLNEYMQGQVQLTRQYDYLKEHLSEYEKWEKGREEIIHKKKRRRAIIDKCRLKKNLISEIKILRSQKNKLIKDKNNIQDIFNEIWFEEYEKYKDEKRNYRKVNENIHNSTIELREISLCIETLKEDVSLYKAKKEKLEYNNKKWKSQLQNIRELEKEFFTEDKIKQLEAQKKEYNKKLQLCTTKKTYLENVLLRISMPSIQYGNLMSEDEKSKIELLQQKEEKLKNIINIGEEKEKKRKIQYEKMKSSISNLEKLIVLVRKDIEENNISSCPVCNSKFRDKDELLSQIDISAQQEAMIILQNQWEIDRKKQKAEEEKYKGQVEKAKQDIEIEIKKLQETGVDCMVRRDEVESTLESNRKIKQKLDDEKEEIKQDILEKLSISLEVLSEEKIEESCNEEKLKLNDILLNNEKKIGQENKKYEELKELIEKDKKKAQVYKKDIDAFNEDSNNQKKLDIMEQRKFDSKEGYELVIKKYSESIQEYSDKEEKKRKNLNKYSIYYTENIEKYEQLWSNIKIPYMGWVEKYEQYQEKLFKTRKVTIKNIVLKEKQINLNLIDAQKKLDIFNQCISDIMVHIYIKQYNNDVELKEKLQKEQKFNECKKDVSKRILQNVQEQLEEYIKNAFGGITINQIYSKIESHKRFTQLQYKLGFSQNGDPEMYRRVFNKKGEELMPELFFSSAQLNTVALSVFLGGALAISNPKVNTVFIDDPIGHFDDLNVLSFIDVLRTIVSKTNWQIIISTHEENFYEIMKVKLSPEYYNSKFFVLQDEGEIVQDI